MAHEKAKVVVKVGRRYATRLNDGGNSVVQVKQTLAESHS